MTHTLIKPQKCELATTLSLDDALGIGQSEAAPNDPSAMLLKYPTLDNQSKPGRPSG